MSKKWQALRTKTLQHVHKRKEEISTKIWALNKPQKEYFPLIPNLTKSKLCRAGATLSIHGVK